MWQKSIKVPEMCDADHTFVCLCLSPHPPELWSGPGMKSSCDPASPHSWSLVRKCSKLYWNIKCQQWLVAMLVENWEVNSTWEIQFMIWAERESGTIGAGVVGISQHLIHGGARRAYLWTLKLQIIFKHTFNKWFYWEN